jgi:hypothetical protein
VKENKNDIYNTVSEVRTAATISKTQIDWNTYCSVLPARLGLKAYHSSRLSEARGLDCFQPETEPQAICVCG